jgi:hypothetical protein
MIEAFADVAVHHRWVRIRVDEVTGRRLRSYPV